MSQPGAEKAERMVLPREIGKILARARKAVEKAEQEAAVAMNAVEEAEEHYEAVCVVAEGRTVKLLEEAVLTLEGAVGPCDLTRDLRTLANELEEMGRQAGVGE